MADQEHSAGRNEIEPASAYDRMRRDGPFWLAALLSSAGLLFLAIGSITIVPWISDERERQTIRSIWLALSRNLPDIGPDALVKAGFWLLLILIAALSIGLMLLASTVRDEPEPGVDPPA